MTIEGADKDTYNVMWDGETLLLDNARIALGRNRMKLLKEKAIFASNWKAIIRSQDQVVRATAMESILRMGVLPLAATAA